MSQKLLILTKDMYTKYWYLLCIISVIRINIKYIFITNLIGDLNVDNIFYKISQLKILRLWFTFFLDGVSTIIVDGVLDVGRLPLVGYIIHLARPRCVLALFYVAARIHFSVVCLFCGVYGYGVHAWLCWKTESQTN